MVDSESSTDAMEVDLRVNDFSLRSDPSEDQRHRYHQTVVAGRPSEERSDPIEDQQHRYQTVVAGRPLEERSEDQRYQIMVARRLPEEKPEDQRYQSVVAGRLPEERSEDQRYQSVVTGRLPEESIDLSIRPRSCSSPESLDYRYRHRWDQQPVRTSPEECKEVHLNGHINGFSDSSQLDSTDSEMSEMPLCFHREMSQVERKHHHALMQRLKEELRNEEMKLVLLKKLRQSQSLKDSLLVPTPAAPVAAPQVGKVAGRPSYLPTGRHKMSPIQSLLIPPMSHNNRSLNALSVNLMQSVLRPGLVSSRMPVTTPPNVVIGYQPTSSGNKTSQNQISQVSPNTSSPTPQSGEAHQTPAQRQAAAKLALRKQLEKTLLQIPPPKPPPPEMHFIPNANNQEFVYLLGLEVVVGFLVGDDQRKKPPPDPFDCVQCCTDFTPVWKWQETSSKRRHLPAVICESCVTTNIKKALKAEHTNRLKTAFVKALQQEQEIEQRMSQGSGSPPPLCVTPPIQRASTPPTSHSPSASAVAAAVANSAALLQQMPKLSAAHQSLLQAQQLQQLPQPAHMLPFGPLLAAQAYSYSMMGKSSASDLQRQYLLDMIPPRSMSQSTMNWKT